MTDAPHQIVVLMPLYAMPKPDPTYQNPVIENCPDCGTKAWMTDRKRMLRDMGHPTMCALCAIQKYGPNIDIIDIAKPN